MKQPTQCEQSEPTFNEMLNTLALILERGYFTETMTAHLEAIRAILEQHQVNQNALQILKDVQVALRPLGIELTWDGEKAGD